MTNKLDGLSMNIEQTNLEKLRTVFPDCVHEGKVDINKLLALLGEYDKKEFEKYRFEWNGKAECLRLAQQRSSGTLRPCPEESVNFDATGNLYIEGDNLEVLKLLQTSYYRKVKMIYIDPPTIPATILSMRTILLTRWRGIRKSPSRLQNPIQRPWDGIIPTG